MTWVDVRPQPGGDSAAVAGLRDLAAGRGDLLAEVAGVLEECAVGRPSDWTPRTSASNPQKNKPSYMVITEHMLGARFSLGRRVMPLPEDEERQLQEIEQALCRDDPKFARLMRGGDSRVRYKRELVHALLGIMIGIGLLMPGALIHCAYLEAVGAVIIPLSLAWAVLRWRRYRAGIRPARSRAGTKTAKDTQHQSGQTRRARMMERMEERWRRRQEGRSGSGAR